MSGREYRVERSSRPAAREPYDDFESASRQMSRRDYDYDDPYAYPRGSRDALSRMTTRSERGSAVPGSEITAATKTTYKVAKERGSDAYVKRANVIVLDSRLDRDRDLSDWEIIRPERSQSGAYVIETSSTSDYASPPGRRRDSFYDEASRPNMGRDLEVLSPPPRSRRERSMSRGTLEAMQQVRVTEDYSSDEDRQNIRSRRTSRPHTKAEIDAAVGGQSTLSRLKSIIRHDHSPESVTRRRSRSIGFIKKQLSHHDATESKHERPGAEANVAGRYLIDHRGERIRRRDEDDEESSVGGYKVRRSKTDVIDTYGAEVERRNRDGRMTQRYEEDDFDRRKRSYPPQKERRRYRKEDQDDDKYSEYYDKRSTKKYY